MGQGVFNIHFDPSKKDTFYFSNYYHSYCFDYNYSTKIPLGVCGIIVGKGDTMQYLYFDRVKLINPKEWEFTNIDYLRLLVDQWDKYKQECWNDSTFTGIINTNPDRNRKTNSATTLLYFEPHYDTIWEHKQPALEGFMQWLKEKVK